MYLAVHPTSSPNFPNCKYVPILDSVRSSLSLSSKPQTADADADTKLHSTSSSRYPKTSGPPSWQQIKKGHSHTFSLRRCTRNAGTVTLPLKNGQPRKILKLAGWLHTYIYIAVRPIYLRTYVFTHGTVVLTVVIRVQ